jgi:hypothetical protein
LWFSQSGNYPENNLAKSGYDILDMKVDQNKNKNISIFLANLSRTYHKNLVKILGHFFFEKNPLYMWKSWFFQVEI